MANSDPRNNTAVEPMSRLDEKLQDDLIEHPPKEGHPEESEFLRYVNSLTPDELAKQEKALVRKIDRHIIPTMFVMMGKPNGLPLATVPGHWADLRRSIKLPRPQCTCCRTSTRST